MNNGNNLVPLKDGLKIWNEKLYGNQINNYLNNIDCRKRKNSSFYVFSNDPDGYDICFNVGLTKIGNRYYVDKEKITNAAKRAYDIIRQK